MRFYAREILPKLNGKAARSTKLKRAASPPPDVLAAMLVQPGPAAVS